MDLQIQCGIGCLQRTNDGFYLCRVCDADGIAEAAGGHAGVDVIFQEIHYSLRIVVFALKRAAEGRSEIHHDIQVGVGRTDLLVGFQRLLVGAVDVGLVVALAQGHNIADLAQAQLVGVLSTAQVGHQGKQIQSRVFFQDSLGDCFGVGQLRDGLGADKGGILHVLDACRDQLINDVQLQFGGDRWSTFHALESVTGADFNNFDFAHNLITLFCVISTIPMGARYGKARWQC